MVSSQKNNDIVKRLVYEEWYFRVLGLDSAFFFIGLGFFFLSFTDLIFLRMFGVILAIGAVVRIVIDFNLHHKEPVFTGFTIKDYCKKERRPLKC